MKRLMILGGSVAQLGAIRAARAEGHHVIVADRNPDAVGAAEAHEFVRASTFDQNEIMDAARRSRPDGLLVVATDQPVLIASRVCEALGVHYPVDPATALLATNKGHMKRRLTGAGIPTPAYTLVESSDPGDAHQGTTPATTAAPHPVSEPGCPDLTELRAPLVVKPVDNQGQRGVSLCRTGEAAVSALSRARAFSRQSAVLIEEYYPSVEVTVSGWVTAGRAQVLTITDRVTIDQPGSLGVCAAHRFPSAYASGHERGIIDLTRRVVHAFGIQAGPIYVQMLIGDAGVKVNEVACRLGGAFEDHSLPLVTGVDVLERAIAESLGEPGPSLPDDGTGCVPTAGAFSVPLFYCTPGVIAAMSDLRQARRIPGVRAVEWLQPAGCEIRTMTDSSQRAGYAVVHGPDRVAVNATLRGLLPHLSVMGTDGRELLMDTLSHCSLPAGTTRVD